MDKPSLPSSIPSQEDAAAVGRLSEARARLRSEIAKAVVGQDTVLDHLLMALLCRGHVLMLGVPGLGKTLMARTIARALDMDYRRIQFTPDLMPSDITGTDIIEEDPETGRRKLEFFAGPLFTHFLLRTHPTTLGKTRQKYVKFRGADHLRPGCCIHTAVSHTLVQPGRASSPGDLPSPRPGHQRQGDSPGVRSVATDQDHRLVGRSGRLDRLQPPLYPPP
jgi:MoxR-like ATPase